MAGDAGFETLLDSGTRTFGSPFRVSLTVGGEQIWIGWRDRVPTVGDVVIARVDDARYDDKTCRVSGVTKDREVYVVELEVF